VRGKNAAVAAVLVLVILCAVVVVLRSLKSGADVPDEILAKPVKLISAEAPFDMKTVTQGELLKLRDQTDEETSYYVIDGKKWSTVRKCNACGGTIPLMPHKRLKPGEAPAGPGPGELVTLPAYKCPLCGKNANAAAPPKG